MEPTVPLKGLWDSISPCKATVKRVPAPLFRAGGGSWCSNGIPLPNPSIAQLSAAACFTVKWLLLDEQYGSRFNLVQSKLCFLSFKLQSLFSRNSSVRLQNCWAVHHGSALEVWLGAPGTCFFQSGLLCLASPKQAEVYFWSAFSRCVA